MNPLIFWMIKDNWRMHWRKWKYYFREDLHLFGVLFLLDFLIGMHGLLRKQINFERESMEQSAREAASSIFSNDQGEQLILLLSILKMAVLILFIVLFISAVIFFFSHSLKELLIQKEVIQFKCFENISISRIVAELLLEKWGSLPIICLLSVATASVSFLKLRGNDVFVQQSSFFPIIISSLVTMLFFLFVILLSLYLWMIKKAKALEILH